MRSAIPVLALCGLSTIAHAQFGWDPNCSTSTATMSSSVNGNTNSVSWSDWGVGPVPPGADEGNMNGYIASFGGPGCSDYASVAGRVSVVGLGSNEVTIRFFASVLADHYCLDQCDPWLITANSAVNAAACLLVNNAVGPNVTINYKYNAVALLWTVHEGFAEDPVSILNTQLDIGPVGIAPNALNLDSALLPPGYASIGASDDDSFSFDPTSGPLTVALGMTLAARLQDPGEGQDRCPVTGFYDQSSGCIWGVITLGINTPAPPTNTGYTFSAPTAPPPGYTPQAFDLEWGIDIGSDAELSDTNSPLNNVFDPGDMYARARSPLPFGGANGVRDDFPYFAPAPFFPEPGPVGPAPVCSFPPLADLPSLSTQYLDTDASDALDIDIRTVVDPFLPLRNPAARYSFNTATIHGANHLLLSFDEDDSIHYAHCSLPTNAFSGHAPYGSTARADELYAQELIYFPTAAFPPISGFVGVSAPVAAENALHPSLASNPDPLDPATYAFNDDVDALDAQWSAGQADHWYFSVDSEAHSFDPFSGINLDPGDVYLAVAAPPAPVPVVDHRIHLGLRDGVDIDAFEFVWLPNPNAVPPAETLALLFSVDDDDPFTTPDESGGLDPAMLYASFLDGVSFPLLPLPAHTDIDAITTWSRTLAPLPAPCVADLAPPFGQLDFSDVIAFLTAFANQTPAADLTHDGAYDFSDVIAFLVAFSAGCP